MANKKLIERLDNLTKAVSDFIHQPCQWHESDLGGRFAIYTKGACGCLIDKIIGFGKFDDLLSNYQTLIKGWNLSKEYYSKEQKDEKNN